MFFLCPALSFSIHHKNVDHKVVFCNACHLAYPFVFGDLLLFINENRIWTSKFAMNLKISRPTVPNCLHFFS